MEGEPPADLSLGRVALSDRRRSRLKSSKSAAVLAATISKSNDLS
jgi:hypothetical protein